MKVIWAILCERVAIDRETNNLSLFNVIEEVAVPAQPPLSLSEAIPKGVISTTFELVVLWVRSDLDVPERGLGRIRIQIPEVSEEITQEHEVDLSQFLRLRSRLRLPGLPAGGEGIYRFIIEGKPPGEDWNQMFELPLRVVFQAHESD